MFDELSQSYLHAQGRLCAFVKWSPAQRCAYLAVFLFLVGAFCMYPYETWVIVSYALSLFFAAVVVIRMGAAALSVVRNPSIRVTPARIAELKDDELPLYSIMVPLYREPEVLGSLLGAMDALDYPKDKLDVQLLVEPDDDATLKALQETGLPSYIRITLSPRGLPRTKPRACNEGLQNAKGSFLVVFDAEDRPEPDQLKKAVLAYRNLPPNVVCLQSRLDHYNSSQGLFAMWSAVEYLVWFRIVLPGLQMLGAPIPLGGTSNHFRFSALHAMGGWDPFNVTEDCDLGMRIAREGWRTRMLDSTTWEESVVRFGPWIRQRTRWIKGYWQTWLVHSRGSAIKEFGPWKWMLFAAITAGGPVSILLYPLMWAVMIAWLLFGWAIVDYSDPASVVAMVLSISLFAANALFLAINLFACVRYKRGQLAPAALLSPVAWALMGISAWRAACQMITNPFHWEKTGHGHGLDDVVHAPARRFVRAAVPAVLSVCAFIVGVALMTGIVSERVRGYVRQHVDATMIAFGYQPKHSGKSARKYSEFAPAVVKIAQGGPTNTGTANAATESVPLPQEASRKQPDGLTFFEANAATIPKFGRFEVAFGLPDVFENPFDPEQADIRGRFISPSGRESEVPAFFYQPFARELKDGKEIVNPVGEPSWRIRFAPSEAGEYKYSILVFDKGKPGSEGFQRTFTCASSNSHGFVHPSTRDRRYMEFDDGSFFYPIGHNLCIPTDRERAFNYPFKLPVGEGTYVYDRYFARMAENGENWTRVRMLASWVGLETEKKRANGMFGVGRYNMANAWKLDHIVEDAENSGIYINLNFDHYSEFDETKSWAYNVYNVANGGMLRNPEDFLRNALARKAYRNRLRYIVARWGYSPNILAWEFWGEANLMDRGPSGIDNMARWHKEMANSLRSLDPWKHMVFTHCHVAQFGKPLFALSEIDCVATNGYIRWPNLNANQVLNFINYYAEFRDLHKLLFIAEYGSRQEDNNFSPDNVEANLHTGLWASFVTPLSGSAMHWWWNYIDGADKYFHYKALAGFAKGIDRLRVNFTPTEFPVRDSRGALRSAGMLARDEAFCWVYNPKAFTTMRSPILQDAKLVFTGLEPGDYKVVYWDTIKGEAIREEILTNTGNLEMSLPPVKGDMAVKARKVE